MFVDGLPEGRGTEVGHKHFQHPGRGTKEFGPNMDRFSFIVLRCQSHRSIANRQPITSPEISRGRTRQSSSRPNDFANPSTSEDFPCSANASSALTRKRKRNSPPCAGAPVTSVPTLTDFIAGRNIPVLVARRQLASGPREYQRQWCICRRVRRCGRDEFRRSRATCPATKLSFVGQELSPLKKVLQETRREQKAPPTSS